MAFATEARGSATVIPEFRIGTCGVGADASPCAWPCDAFVSSSFDLECSCDDGSGAQFCAQEGACSTGTCPTCALDAVNVFVGRLVIEVDDDACLPGQGGAKVTMGLRGSRQDGSPEFTAVSKVFDFCNVNVLCDESCEAVCAVEQCNLGGCQTCDPQQCGQGSCPPATTFVCELADSQLGQDPCSGATSGRRFCEADVIDDGGFTVVDWLRRAKQPIFEILGHELTEAGGVFEGYDGTAVIEHALEADVVDNAATSEPSRGEYCIKVWMLREAKPTPIPGSVLNVLQNATACSDPACSLAVSDMGACDSLVPICGDNVQDPGEQCDGTSDTACPGACGANCRCVATCPPTPSGGCITGAKASLKISRRSDTTKDQLKWKLQKGGSVGQSDLGDPIASTALALCIYDETANVPSLAAQIDIGSGIGWKSKAPKGFDYKDKSGAQHGVRKLQLRTGDAGKSKVGVTAKGSSTAWPSPVSETEYVDQDDGVTVQLVTSTTATCWSTELATVKRNDSEQYKARSP
ncbi:MAG: hypothetical protein E4H00_00345 [Myxococcales bacterium]|nr:MAG: hypothetical protein E4H00_00345 [Myxococcales bacterium]